MTWLVPIGFLGLLGVGALIAIYIIKPNYQQKMISSTYVWKLSLKYRRKRLPINRINNIIQFLCQILILTICGLLLAQPVLASEKVGDDSEKVIIIDSSASMLISSGNETRFERAVNEVKLAVEDTVEKGGVVSVILADSDPEFLAQRISIDNVDALYEKLDELTCSYSSADVTGAVALAEEVLNYNNEAQVYFYTATEYIDKNGIITVDMSNDDEWNAAVLNCTAKLDNSNHYEISVDVGCYGKTESIDIYCRVYDANGKPGETVELMKPEYFDPTAEERTVVFSTDDFGSTPLYSFNYIEVYINVDDSFADDNSFFLYGGKKQTIKIQYASSNPNLFFGGAVRTIRENMKDKWDIQFTELKADEKAATEGFDFYIFEHRMPDVMPTDGVVLLVDPGKAPDGSDLQIGELQSVKSDSTLASGVSHELLNYVDCNRITIAGYREIRSSGGYQELGYYQGNPVILAKNEPDAKVVVWAFDLHYSNLIALPDFSFMMYNMFNYYIPSTLSSSAYEIGDTVELNSRGTELSVSGNGVDTMFEGQTGELEVTLPGTYTVTQKPMQGEELIIENFFVRIPEYESDITKEVDELPTLNYERQVEIEYLDLLFYFAIALVSLMFIEWILQTKKNY